MTKNILTKVRRGDENIGKLIVFAVTIIIAVGVLGTLAYFYNQSRQNATKLSVLTSTTSSKADIVKLGFCDEATTDAYIKYTPVDDKYTLYCYQASGTTYTGTVSSSAILGVSGILKDGDCPGTGTVNNTDVGNAICEYKVNR